ncbi:hypothetical protein [Burkholderia multivorans]|uniref:hypothetical protein n=1 Tax=Burkholderia multivorans TaxID=87883 RepID=UPI0015E48D02|nr:hypothetical protein [Burkholderia multivorans]
MMQRMSCLGQRLRGPLPELPGKLRPQLRRLTSFYLVTDRSGFRKRAAIVQMHYLGWRI